MIQVVITITIASILVVSTKKLFEIFYPYMDCTITFSPDCYRDFYYIMRYFNAVQAKNQKVTDEYEGFEVWWTMYQDHFRLTFHRRHRVAVGTRYLIHIHSEGKSIEFKENGPAFYINKGDGEWARILFKHLATFDTLDMDPQKKIDIVNDLTSFSNSENFWTRRYLLSGPPRTRKLAIIAMANLIKFDIYNIKLASLEDNTELKKLLIGIRKRSIVVIEGFDSEKFEVINRELLLWGGDRIIFFTSEKIDASLIRWIDKQVELSNCRFEAFKVLAEQNLLDRIREKMKKTDMIEAQKRQSKLAKSWAEMISR